MISFYHYIAKIDRGIVVAGEYILMGKDFLGVNSMRKMVVNKFDLGSVFRTVLMCMAIPYLFSVIIVFLAFIFSFNGFGFLAAVIMSLLAVGIAYVFQGLVFVILAASYNWLAPRYGGLTVDMEKENVE